jgi:NAD(P)H-flavin reductase
MRRALGAAGLGMAPIASLAQAIERGTSATGVAYVWGGTSHEELELLRAERLSHSFWLEPLRAVPRPSPGNRPPALKAMPPSGYCLLRQTLPSQ